MQAVRLDLLTVRPVKPRLEWMFHELVGSRSFENWLEKSVNTLYKTREVYVCARSTLVAFVWRTILDSIEHKSIAGCHKAFTRSRVRPCQTDKAIGTS